MNAAYLMYRGFSGYMSCIKNLKDPNPENWIAAGCPLPTMMGIERRKGKNKPVITKALVRLDGGMFKCYQAVRAKWAALDCYKSPGPIQFTGAGSTEGNYMVEDPDTDVFIYETDAQERYEQRVRESQDDQLFRQESSLSHLSQARIKADVQMPKFFQSCNFRPVAIKKYTPVSQLVEIKISEQFEKSHDLPEASHFFEFQDKLVADQGTYHYQDANVEAMNKRYETANNRNMH